MSGKAEFKYPTMKDAWENAIDDKERKYWIDAYGSIEAGFVAFCADLKEG